VINQAFLNAERTRRLRKPVSRPQRDTIDYLAGTAGIETPIVRWGNEASDAIDRLLTVVRQPTLGPMH
jgi:hypothetical protein